MDAQIIDFCTYRAALARATSAQADAADARPAPREWFYIAAGNVWKRGEDDTHEVVPYDRLKPLKLALFDAMGEAERLGNRSRGWLLRDQLLQLITACATIERMRRAEA